jgi:hypothetical protein
MGEQTVDGHADDDDHDDNRQYPADKAHELLTSCSRATHTGSDSNKNV